MERSLNERAVRPVTQCTPVSVGNERSARDMTEYDAVSARVRSSRPCLSRRLALAACANNPNRCSNARALPAARRPAAQQDFVVNVGDRVFFETDSTELTPQSRRHARQAGAVAAAATTATPSRSRATPTARHERIQLALGDRRAKTVRDYLSSRAWLSRVRTISYGKERPVAVCKDIAAGRRTAALSQFSTRAP